MARIMGQVSLISLIVADYDEAIAFFTDLLEFELVEDSPSVSTHTGTAKRWVIVRPPGAETGVLLSKAEGEVQRAAIGDQFAGRVGLFYTVDEFDRLYAKLKAGGVEFLTEARDEPYGRVAVFRDLAGNRWDLLGPHPNRTGRDETRQP